MTISIGKWRRLQQTASACGAFSVLAIDHRGPLRRALEAESSQTASDATLTALKQDVVRALESSASAVLLDAETSAAQCVATGALGGQTGLITALDTGSTGDPAVRETGLVEGWNVEKAARMGAAGVKLLIYYHPDSADASQRERLVRTIGQACTVHDMPFFLEPLSCSADGKQSELSSSERTEVVVETAQRLVPLGVDVLKAEFPLDVNEESDERQWRRACERLSSQCPIPWVLLSAGVSFDTFLRQAQVACDAGASGVMVGRAVWKEAVTLDVVARNRFLNGVGRERMDRLCAVCNANGRPFKEIHERPNPKSEWYKEYGGSG